MAKNKKKQCPGESKAPKRLPTLRPGMVTEPLRSPLTDPFGSYTGNAVGNETPVQDADDL